MLVNSEDKTCTSVVSSLLDSDNPVRISNGSNVTSSRIEVEELLLVVSWHSDRHWVLVSSNLSVFPEQDSAATHAGPDEERLSWSQVGALVDWLGHRVGHFEPLVETVVARPHMNSRVVSVSSTSNIHAEVRVERLPVVVLVPAVSPLLVRVPLSSSENDLCTSVSIALQNTESIVSVKETSNVSALRVEVHKLVLSVSRLANGSLVLTVCDSVVEEHDSSTRHS
jgi:hypothetical protein